MTYIMPNGSCRKSNFRVTWRYRLCSRCLSSQLDAAVEAAGSVEDTAGSFAICAPASAWPAAALCPRGSSTIMGTWPSPAEACTSDTLAMKSSRHTFSPPLCCEAQTLQVTESKPWIISNSSGQQSAGTKPVHRLLGKVGGLVAHKEATPNVCIVSKHFSRSLQHSGPMQLCSMMSC